MNNRDTVLAVLETYELGAIRTIHELQGGMFLKPLKVESDRGTFVLRLHTFREESSLFQYQAEILQQAALEGVLCPQVIPTGDGSWGVPTPDGYFAIHEYVEGIMHDWETWYRLKACPGFLEGLGRHVARMHDVLRRIRVDGEETLDITLPPIQFEELEAVRLNWREGLEWLIQKSCATEPAPRKLLEVADRVEIYWDRLEKGAIESGLVKLVTQPVHGDVSAVNLIFSNQGTEDPEQAVFIDWDCVHQGPRIYDALGDILLRCPSGRPEWNRFSLNEITRYLNSYCATSEVPLEDSELETVGVCLLARQLEDLRQRLQIAPELPESAGKKNAQLIEMRLEMMDQIEMDPSVYLRIKIMT